MTYIRYVIIFSLIIFIFCPFQESNALTNEKNLPQFTLNLNGDNSTQKYLGLKNNKSFSISSIQAKLILIEVFSLYCPICQKQAPIANKIYKYIEQNAELSKDIKMIGIGAGNNEREVGVFRETFRVPFPLFTDPKFVVHKKLGEPRTPTTILTTNNGKILSVHCGVIEDVEEFVKKIKYFHAQQ
jgi:thiol-disulfide isomerase/thioredoxin